MQDIYKQVQGAVMVGEGIQAAGISTTPTETV